MAVISNCVPGGRFSGASCQVYSSVRLTPGESSPEAAGEATACGAAEVDAKASAGEPAEDGGRDGGRGGCRGRAICTAAQPPFHLAPGDPSRVYNRAASVFQCQIILGDESSAASAWPRGVTARFRQRRFDRHRRRLIGERLANPGNGSGSSPRTIAIGIAELWEPIEARFIDRPSRRRSLVRCGARSGTIIRHLPVAIWKAAIGIGEPEVHAGAQWRDEARPRAVACSSEYGDFDRAFPCAALGDDPACGSDC